MPAERPQDQTAELRDGSKVRIVAARPEDGDALLGFLRSLSVESRPLRIFSPAYDLEAAAQLAAAADGTDHIGLIALDTSGQIVGHAACVRVYGPRGEVTVEVAEDHRNLGLASLLLRRLAYEAQRQGIRTLIAEVLADNHEMLAVFHDELQAKGSAAGGEVNLEFPSSAWDSGSGR